MSRIGTIDTLLRVKADASGAVRGLAPLQASLEATAADAGKTEAALEALGGQHKVTLNTQAIAAAQAEIDRLRDEMAKQLLIDPKADTRAAQRQISQLQRNIKTLDAQHPVVEVSVETEGADEGAGGLLGGLTAATKGMSLMKGATLASTTALTIWGTVAVVATKEGIKFGQMAADVETSVTTLGALTGDQKLGEDLFADLQLWAKTTPFAIDDATESAKKLLAAGVPLSEITDNLSDMGNVASATDVPLAQIATVFAQMESKGKATFEELQQLAEAGVPVWATLADNMGLTVAEVQKMATEGKLGADAIDLVREAMAAQFPTAMTDQAATFNGQMSTLKDTLDQTGQTLGLLFLPLMTKLVEAFNTLAGWVYIGVGWLIKFDDKLQDISGSGVLDHLLNIATFGSWTGIEQGVVKLSDLADETADLGDDTVMTQEEIDALAASVKADAEEQEKAAAATKVHAEEMQALADKVDATKTKYEDLVDSFSIMNNQFVTGQQLVSDYEGSLDDLAKSLVENGGNFDLDKVAGRENFANLVALAEDAGARVVKTFKEKGPAAAAAMESSFRGTFTQMLIDAGVAPERAKALIDQVFKTPVKVKFELEKIDLAQLRKEKARLLKKKAELELPFQTRLQGDLSPRAIDQINIEMQNAVKPVDAKIEAKTTKIDAANDDLDGVAKPKGEDRTAKVQVKVPQPSIDQANADIDGIIKLRRSHVKIYVDVVPPVGPGAQFFGLPATAPAPSAAPPTAAPVGLRTASAAMLAAPAPHFGPYAAAGTVPGGHPAQAGRVTRLAPRQTPVAVYLDGVEIAHRIEARRALAATESVRRSA